MMHIARVLPVRRGPIAAEALTHLSVRVPRRILRAAKVQAHVEGVRLQAFVAAACAAKLERGSR